MKWEARFFKGKKVFAKVDEEGELIVEENRVEIKYTESENAKIYRASKSNLSRKSADEIEQKAAQKRTSDPSKKRGKSGTHGGPHDELIWKNPQGKLISNTTEPEALQRLTRPGENEWEIYTDGACSGNPGPCGFGLVIRKSNSFQELSQYIGVGTNNIAELFAIYHALKLLQEEKAKGKTIKAVIHTDSQLSIGLLSQNWKPKVNIELVESCKSLMKGLKITFKKVKGHAGIPQNERADEIAVASVKSK